MGTIATNFETTLDAHPNIYNGYSSRKFKVFFSVPDNGVNRETGIALLISCFGASSNSKVYKKMRKKFADDYNFITIQCDYFGHEFMEDTGKVTISGDFSPENLLKMFTVEEVNSIYKTSRFDFNEFTQIAAHNKLNLQVNVSLNESIENFNDMGLMQAMDNINAVLAVIAILKDNRYSFNMNKVVAYGHSHGA